jgi:hypothetical protein
MASPISVVDASPPGSGVSGPDGLHCFDLPLEPLRHAPVLLAATTGLPVLAGRRLIG